MELVLLLREVEGGGIVAWPCVSHCVAGDHVLPVLGLWKKRDSVYSPEEEQNLEPRVEARHLLLLPLPDTRERVRGTEGQVMGIPAHSPFPIFNLVACFLCEGQRSISFHFIYFFCPHLLLA